MLPAHSSDCPTPALRSCKTQFSPSRGKSLAKRLKNDCISSVLVQLSLREQQVSQYRNQGFSFEDISHRLCCPLTVVLGYYRRARTKLERELCTQSTYDLVKASTPVTLEQAFIKLTHQRQSSVSDYLASALGVVPVEHPNLIELCVSSLFVTGDRVASVCEQPNDTANTDLVHGRKLLTSVPFHSPAEGWLSLDEALTTFPALQEQVIWLRSQEYLSYREIGDRLGCSEADVSIAVDLALRSLNLSERPPRQRRRKRSNRRTRQMGVGFRVAAAS